ncbi:methyltransferase [Desulfuromonas acetoxidans]|uniref:RNA methylase n=1 Tax=Desulfuromonas acetoxidans (strain DSM 684 / 11070) TaxID=281689 RepID=Q1JY11_DESA6|nr:methyltransferase [Desulfuromonas acetoxidans]EAT15185.1 putative RNA methylase [Desulfuromonas acetoxidans DSM 684]MBF0644012.1 methyltransferase [Desulfuromonas acetoxidans]NVD23250.1 methyltransferase [Desulfuromonas acetoxidans]NVE15509.1 methyltransferase [Desulfuromonas acetoxidans]
MKNTEEQFYAIVAPGFESVCADELKSRLQVPVSIEHGGVTFHGKLRELYLANLWSRCASRIVVRLGDFNCRDFPTLYRKAVRLPWGRFLKPGTAIDVRTTCRQSRLNHSGRIGQTISEAIGKALGTPVSQQDTPFRQQILVRLDNDHCQISIDSSAERLHRRGYRQQMTPAPLRETLAAGCLLQCHWNGDSDFLDALCGSGTLAIEAAMIAGELAPGRQRVFAFQHWPGYRGNLWQSLLHEAKHQQRTPSITITASDQDEQAIHAARTNAKAAGVDQWIHFEQCPYQQQHSSGPQGLWLSNPPYGERLQQSQTTPQLLQALHAHFDANFSGWHGAMILPHPLRGVPAPQLQFRNGGLPVALYPLHQPAP